MVLALVLAQLVLPGPPSKPLSPPGMICMGECSDGPMVWRASPARGRLVVACDMRSDTCSDGRKISTTRPTPVPCEVSPGVWEMVPEHTACISWRGLEVWAANTSYLSWGAELDNPAWTATFGGVIEKLEHGYRLTGNRQDSRVQQGGIPASAGTWTLACIMRSAQSGTRPQFRLLGSGGGGGGFCSLGEIPEGFAVYSCTQEIAEVAETLTAFVYSHAGAVDISGCWLTRTDTPGRACWGGEAPVTCAADRHTISTEGWPTTEGEISMVVELNEQIAAGRNAWLFDGRDAGDLMGVNPYIQPDGRLRFRVAGTVYGSESPMLTWEVGRPYALRFLRKGGRTEIYRDGALVYSVATTDWAWVPSAHLGMNFSFTGPDIALTIRSLTVRSYEEVSP